MCLEINELHNVGGICWVCGKINLRQPRPRVRYLCNDKMKNERRWGSAVERTKMKRKIVLLLVLLGLVLSGTGCLVVPPDDGGWHHDHWDHDWDHDHHDWH
jgi:hypothetical protein